jgi:RHS repeat-associated protein
MSEACVAPGGLGGTSTRFQLIEEEKPGLSYLATYTYDDNGNRLTRTVNSVTENYTYDAADKLLDISVNSSVVKEYTYDAAGRTTAITANSQTTSFSYDYEGRITQITYPSTNTDSFGYNGLGSRTSTSGVNGSRSFLRNGLSVTSPVLSDGTADYTPGVSRRASSATKFSHAGLKNTNTQSAENETIAASRVYDAFGNLVSTSGTWGGPFGYAGNFGYQEDGSGLRLLGYRYLDSSIGRFITIDPYHFGRNWQAYCANSPVRRTDPEGLLLIFIGVGLAVLGIGKLAADVYVNIAKWQADREYEEALERAIRSGKLDDDSFGSELNNGLKDRGQRAVEVVTPMIDTSINTIYGNGTYGISPVAQLPHTSPLSHEVEGTKVTIEILHTASDEMFEKLEEANKNKVQ